MKSLKNYTEPKEGRSVVFARVPESLAKRFATTASRDGLSMSKFIEALLRREAEIRRKK